MPWLRCCAAGRQDCADGGGRAGAAADAGHRQPSSSGGSDTSSVGGRLTQRWQLRSLCMPLWVAAGTEPQAGGNCAG